MTLHIIATGGTFDKHYDEIAGKLVLPIAIYRKSLRARA